MEETAFKVVLVDIEQAALRNEIHCVKRPLCELSDLEFVAVSYRWGELTETVIHTNIGYSACVTSFHLDDFYNLCKRMTEEHDLRSIKYVWVDAICVNQTDHDQRKATIYRMTDIYERAKYILAVPDLHLTYLKDTNTRNRYTIDQISQPQYSRYIYHLLHHQENTAQLIQLDEQWLDSIDVPKERATRQKIIKNTSQFMDGLKKYQPHDTDYDITNSLDHIKEAMRDTLHISRCYPEFVTINDTIKLSTFEEYHHDVTQPKSICSDDGEDWSYQVLKQIKSDKWKQQISKRNQCIQQSIHFLEDLIKDWSSRVWVIKEFNIAKKCKEWNKLKYWFIQLQQQSLDNSQSLDDSFKFFEFNFDDLTSRQRNNNSNNNHTIFNSHSINHALTIRSKAIYQQFRNTMLRQLNEQSFLEMMLKSRATRNDDRFHAIFPLSKYKAIIENKDVVTNWKINSLVAVKLKLFEVMDTLDKLNLLFLSTTTSHSIILALPTFATSKLDWPSNREVNTTTTTTAITTTTTLDHDKPPCNFDLNDAESIELIPTTIKDNDKQHRLRLKPHEYYICQQPEVTLKTAEKMKTLCDGLKLDPNECQVVCIPSYGDSDVNAPRHTSDFYIKQLFLIGSFTKKKWMMTTSFIFTLSQVELPTWKLDYNENKNFGFDIY